MGTRKKLCEGLAKLPPSPTDAQRIANLAEDVIRERYGPNFAADCFFDSQASRTRRRRGRDAQRAERTVVALAEVLRAGVPAVGAERRAAFVAAPHARQADAAVLDHAFGAGTSAALAAVKPRLQRWGRQAPTAPPLPTPASSIFYLEFSDDPWEGAGVAAGSPSCLGRPA